MSASASEPRWSLPNPGVVGRAIRLVLGLLVLSVGVSLANQLRRTWPASDVPVDLSDLVVLVFVAATWSAVVNKLVDRAWGTRPLWVALSAAAVASIVGAAKWHTLLNSSLDAVLCVWVLAWSFLLGPALLLAAVLGTPGCEMRSYAHLAARMTGRDPTAVTCPGGVDACDRVRLFGRW